MLFDGTERMLGLGPDAGLEILQFIDQSLVRTALVKCLALAKLHGHMPSNMQVFSLISLCRALVYGLCEDIAFLAVGSRMINDLFLEQVRV